VGAVRFWQTAYAQGATAIVELVSFRRGRFASR
jgi:hypothetical protein